MDLLSLEAYGWVRFAIPSVSAQDVIFGPGSVSQLAEACEQTAEDASWQAHKSSERCNTLGVCAPIGTREEQLPELTLLAFIYRGPVV